MTDEARTRQFHERFDIDLEIGHVQQRFTNRAFNLVFDRIDNGYLGDMRLSEHQVEKAYLRRCVATVLGETYVVNANLDSYVRGDFYRCLQVLEALYKALAGTGLQDVLSRTIRSVLGTSEVDLGIDWQPPEFVRTGARLLDEQLVIEPLRWLAEPNYDSVRKPFEKGLSHYLEAQNKPDRLADVITDMYEAVEALAKAVTGRSGKDLSANAELFISRLKASQHYKTLLKDYIAYASEFRHAEQQSRPRPSLSEAEVEAFIYLTGLFIRLAIRTTSPPHLHATPESTNMIA